MTTFWWPLFVIAVLWLAFKTLMRANRWLWKGPGNLLCDITSVTLVTLPLVSCVTIMCDTWKVVVQNWPFDSLPSLSEAKEIWTVQRRNQATARCRLQWENSHIVKSSKAVESITACEDCKGCDHGNNFDLSKIAPKAKDDGVNCESDVMAWVDGKKT